MLDRTLRDMSSAERELGMPGLAAVPQSAVRSGPDSLLTSPNCRPETAESFRSLRTSLALLGKGITARTFLFTSANPGEGKSYCAANCAAALAQQGYRTLLIDADMRKPSLDEVFLASPNPAGLASHLSGIAPSGGAKACNPTAIPNLFLFSAGLSSDSHPAELLSSQAFSTLLAEALKWFHRIVIDTPPVNQVTDALLMAREVDSVALVVKAARTSRADARHAISKLSMAGARPVGFVLNGASRDALAGGYTGSYAYGQPLALPYPALALPQPSHA
jgi:capsular exopolysaccharide synthesis family protein